MTLVPVILAVLGAAALHAVWNTAVKGHGDKLVMLLAIALVQAAIALAMVPLVGLPAPEAWMWLALTAIPHTTYKIALAKAYELGDMTRIYPVARGLSIALVTFFSLFLLGETISLWGLMGIAAIALGVFALSLRQGLEAVRLSKAAVALCLGAGASVALYTLLDGIGVRAGQSIVTFEGVASFAAWLFLLDGLGMALFAALYRGRSSFTSALRTGAKGLFAGLAAFACYWVAIWALAHAPVALVAALRETSVLFSLLLGRLYLAEPVSPQRVGYSGLVFLGILMLRFA